jgi:AraC-like DNA-binding protein
MAVLLDIAPMGRQAPEEFNAHLESYLLDDILLSRLITGAQKIQRTSARIARDSIDHYAVNFFLGGSVELQKPVALRYGAGNLICFDNAETLACESPGFDVITATIPRRRLAPLLTRPDAVHASMIDPQSGIGVLLASFVQTLFVAAPGLTRAEASTAASSLLDLLAVALNGPTLRSGDLPAMVEGAELLRVQMFIKEHLALPDLGPEKIAAATGHSRSRLYRIFAPTGGIAEYIREQRLRRCLAELLSVQHLHRQISEIAYSWGFTNPTHFTTAFKQRFGRTPSEAREAVASIGTRAQAKLDPRVGDRIYEEWLAGIA